MDENRNDYWQSVTAKCLAYLCLKNSEFMHAKVLEQAAFLSRLGLLKNDQAAILGTTSDSLGALARQAKKGAKKNGKGKR